ncbi:MAG: LysM peptidoglycan-binding domain-containing protein [Anaerolineales bacterium]|nr:LysM peptidoglycan-binding domain-containing protein [Anaerolineales bacterium]MCB8940066.1 LysM peptidoglycan-binding domain-containing protein [Ardenticatenaceae bacterium]
MKKSRWLAYLFSLLLLVGVVTAVSALTYTVTWGDTLTRIATRFGTNLTTILQANPQISNPNLIYVGQQLEIPTGDNPTPTPQPPPGSTPAPPPTGSQTYIVQPGDTLSAIARRFNTTITAIAQASGISNINLIYVGQRLTIPGSGSVPTSPPPTSGGFALGAQTLNLHNRDHLEEAGMTWVKYQYKWPSEDTLANLKEIIDSAHNEGFKILVTVTGDKPYPTTDSINFMAYIEFMREVAKLGPDGIEVWNEMNIDFEWPAGQISPSSYVNNMLAPAYTTIKAVNSDILVISGALAPTGFDNNTNAWSDARYLSGMRNAGAANYLDCVGVHYNAGATSPSATTGHPADPGDRHYSWYYQPTLTLYRNAFSNTRNLCLTEFGYLTADGFAGLPPGFSWAANTSLDEQALWLAEAAQIAKNSGYVRLAIVFNLDFTKYDPAGDPQAGYAIIRQNGTCPACARLGDVMN